MHPIALPSMLSTWINNMFGRLEGITSLSLFVVERRPLSLDGSQDRLYHAARGLSMRMSSILRECHSEPFDFAQGKLREESAFPLAEIENREQEADFSTPPTLRSK